jgi:uncharacterized protein
MTVPEVVLEVRVRPGGAKEHLTYDPWRKVWTVTVTAPAREGEANRAVVALVARVLAVPASQVILEAGGRSRDKRLRVVGVGADGVEQRLQGFAASSP